MKKQKERKRKTVFFRQAVETFKLKAIKVISKITHIENRSRRHFDRNSVVVGGMRMKDKKVKKKKKPLEGKDVFLLQQWDTCYTFFPAAVNNNLDPKKFRFAPTLDLNLCNDVIDVFLLSSYYSAGNCSGVQSELE